MRLQEYHELFEKIRALRRSERAQFDDAMKEKILKLDRNRHEKHLELLAAGMKIGKDADAVMVDIIREQGDLSDYGLPEFAIMKDWESDTRLPEDSCLLLYDVSYTRRDDRETSHDVEASDDYEVRRARAAALAERVHGRFHDEFNSRFFHEVSTHFVGVIIPKNAVEDVAAIIRDHPDLYRIGEAHYSDEEKAAIEAFRAKKKGGWINEMDLP